MTSDAKPRIVPSCRADAMSERPSGVHQNPCAKCPSMFPNRDPESADILGSADESVLRESLFVCAWRPEKLCHGWRGLVVARLAELCVIPAAAEAAKEGTVQP
jgi:hypothetical protein